MRPIPWAKNGTNIPYTIPFGIQDASAANFPDGSRPRIPPPTAGRREGRAPARRRRRNPCDDRRNALRQAGVVQDSRGRARRALEFRPRNAFLFDGCSEGCPTFALAWFSGAPPLPARGKRNRRSRRSPFFRLRGGRDDVAFSAAGVKRLDVSFLVWTCCSKWAPWRRFHS